VVFMRGAETRKTIFSVEVALVKIAKGENMNRDFLKSLGIQDDAVNQIMAQNGKDIESVKADVSSYIIDPRDLEIWSNDYFLLLADRIKFV